MENVLDLHDEAMMEFVRIEAAPAICGLSRAADHGLTLGRPKATLRSNPGMYIVSLRPYRNISPALAARAYVDSSAVVIGNVKLGEDASVWPTAVLRGDVHSIEIGARSNIQDGSVLHVTHDGPYAPGGRALMIGSDVTVGHRVVLHACTIGNTCLIGMGSVILDDVVIEDLVMIGAGSVVTPGKRLQTRSLYVGCPARRVRDLAEREIAFLGYSAAQYVKLKDEYLQQRS